MNSHNRRPSRSWNWQLITWLCNLSRTYLPWFAPMKKIFWYSFLKKYYYSTIIQTRFLAGIAVLLLAFKQQISLCGNIGCPKIETKQFVIVKNTSRVYNVIFGKIQRRRELRQYSCSLLSTLISHHQCLPQQIIKQTFYASQIEYLTSHIKQYLAMHIQSPNETQQKKKVPALLMLIFKYK